MNNKVYDVLKWIALIVMPALSTLVGTIGLAIQWQYTDLTVTILVALGTFLGTILGVSNLNYNKE